MDRDDAGQPMTILNPAGFSEWPLRGDARIGALLNRIRTAPGQASDAKALWATAALTCLSIVLCGIAISGIKAVWPGVAGLGPHVLMAPVGFVAGAIGWRWRLRFKHSAARRLLLSEGLCPSCGYNLHGLLGVGSGDTSVLVRCPECGAAWDRSKVVRSASFAEGAAYGNPLLLVAGDGRGSSWTTKDDRGEVVALVHPRVAPRRAFDLSRPRWTKQARAARKRVVRANILVRGVVVSVAWLLVPAGAGFFVVLWRQPVNRTSGIVIAAIVVCMFLIVLASWATLGNCCYSASSVRRAMLDEGLCPSCAAELSGPSDAANGCRVCACCRAAWKPAVTVDARGPSCQGGS